MLALGIGTLLAVVALAFVLYPLLFDPTPSRPREFARAIVPTPGREEDAVVALREIEFDRATGKLSDADYAELRRAYTDRALSELRTASVEAVDPVEARVRAYRSARRECVTCGLRPEPDHAADRQVALPHPGPERQDLRRPDPRRGPPVADGGWGPGRQ